MLFVRVLIVVVFSLIAVLSVAGLYLGTLDVASMLRMLRAVVFDLLLG